MADTRFKHRFALLHYLWSGERRGHEPFPGFKPMVHWVVNEAAVGSGESALAHFARTRQGGAAPPLNAEHEPLDEPVVVAGRGGASRGRIAIVCHIYFYHLWGEIADTLARLDGDFDLICTVTEKPAFEEMLASILAFCPDALIVKVPNRGRDILPFLRLIEQGSLSGYDAICKIHTKKSIHRLDGDNWRRTLIAAILSDSESVNAVVDCFRSDPTLGLVAADIAFLNEDADWTGNKARARDICRRIGVAIDDYPLRFAAGSMYWLSPAVIERLRALSLTADDFEREEGQLDDTTAHAFERALGIIVQSMMLKIVGVRELLALSRTRPIGASPEKRTIANSSG